MTAAHIDHASHPSAASVVDCRGACLRARTEAGLTVLAISGEIDAANVDDLRRHARRLVPDSGALIVDLADIGFIAVDGLRALMALDVECARAGTRWALIASHAVNRVLRVAGGDNLLPAVGSVTEALLLVHRSSRGNRPRHLVSRAD